MAHAPDFVYRIIFDAKCITVAMIDGNRNFRSNHLLRCQSTDIKYGRLVTVLWFGLVSLFEILDSILFIDHFETEIRAGIKYVCATGNAEICFSSLPVLRVFHNPYIFHP